ncbi:MAG: Ig-like domain-containing protein, partial [Rickettsiales bacterium]|nr:Ig-like domain-containing protein [Rickettsiales bacterium]MDG4546635.1 Ig-like domain-containing protein [Rickettsiales bacterium]MDG4548782.1 Ig-like domain-containing protein [Rickettsiales bacterium]
YGDNSNNAINGVGAIETVDDTTDFADIIIAGEGNDFISAEGGDDVLYGGSGNDTLTGGFDADKFIIARQLGGATTVITDFSGNTIKEQIDLRAFSHITSFADLQIQEVNGNVEITLNENSGNLQTLVLNNISSTSLSADAFILAPYSEGSNSQANTTSFNQAQKKPSIAGFDNGNYVIVWQSEGQDGDGSGIYGQMFSANGSKIGNEFLVNVTTAGDQTNPSVDVLKNGDFVVTWGNNNTNELYAKVISPADVHNGNELLISDNYRVSSTSPNESVIALENGNFVTVWVANNGTYIRDAYAKILSPDGSTVVPEFQVNNDDNDAQSLSIEELSNGNFVITWGLGNVYGQIYSANGATVGGVFPVNTITTGSNNSQSVAAINDNGDFVVVWGRVNGGNLSGLKGQIFSSDGSKIGSEFSVTNSPSAKFISVTSDTSGGFIATWNASNGSSVSDGIFGKRYDSNGNALGDEFYVDRGSLTSVASLSNGDFVIARQVSSSSTDSEIYATTYTLNDSTETYGTQLADNINGTLSADTIDASDGDDVIFTGGGNDVLTLGSGADTVVIADSDDSTVTINDWDSTDTINLASFADITSIDDLTITAGSAIIHLPDEQFIHILNIEPDDLSSSNFIFSIPTNNAPVANADTASVSEDTSVNIDVVANDTDLDNDNLNIVSVDGSLTTGLVTINPNGTIDYKAEGFFETLGAGDTATDSFAYTISDGKGGIDTATVNLTINGVNDNPIAAKDSATVNEDDSNAIINLLGGATDIDGDTVALASLDLTSTVGIVTDNLDGTVSYDANGQFDYLDAGQTATDSFAYTVSDGNGGSDTKTVTVTVHGIDSPTNTAPVAVADSASVSEDGSINIDVLANDTDADNDTLSVSSLDDSLTVGSVIIDTDGTIKYDTDSKFEYLAAGVDATDTFTYTVSDGNGGLDTQTVTVTINGENDAPDSIFLGYPLVAENKYGEVIGGITFSDVDIGDTHSFGVFDLQDNPDSRFVIEDVGGQLKLKLQTNVALDYETEQVIDLKLKVTDNGGLSFDNNVKIFVTDEAKTIFGTNGDDTINGTIGKDVIYAGDGDDVINSQGGSDLIFAGGGEDTVDAGAGVDFIVAGVGNDTVYGSYGADFIWGNEGDDTLYGGGGNDTINGGEDNDTIYGGADSDAIEGGTGIDTASYQYSDAGVNIDLLNATLSGGFAGGDTLNGIENLTGSDYDDDLLGDHGNNELRGGDGNDYLLGNGGNDIVIGGEGNDIVRGSSGDDILEGGNGNDRLYGDAGNDIIKSGHGSDSVWGGSGNDIFVFEAVSDSTTVGNFFTRIKDFEDGIDLIDISALVVNNDITGFGDLIITNNGTKTTVSANGTDFLFELEGVHALDQSDFVT